MIKTLNGPLTRVVRGEQRRPLVAESHSDPAKITAETGTCL